PRAALGCRLANARLEALEAGRQPQPQIETATVDGAHLPMPAGRAGRPVRAGKSGHALDGHAGALLRGCRREAPRDSIDVGLESNGRSRGQQEAARGLPGADGVTLTSLLECSDPAWPRAGPPSPWAQVSWREPDPWLSRAPFPRISRQI